MKKLLFISGLSIIFIGSAFAIEGYHKGIKKDGTTVCIRESTNSISHSGCCDSASYSSGWLSQNCPKGIGNNGGTHPRAIKAKATNLKKIKK